MHQRYETALHETLENLNGNNYKTHIETAVDAFRGVTEQTFIANPSRKSGSKISIRVALDRLADETPHDPKLPYTDAVVHFDWCQNQVIDSQENALLKEDFKKQFETAIFGLPENTFYVNSIASNKYPKRSVTTLNTNAEGFSVGFLGPEELVLTLNYLHGSPVKLHGGVPAGCPDSFVRQVTTAQLYGLLMIPPPGLCVCDKYVAHYPKDTANNYSYLDALLMEPQALAFQTRHSLGHMFDPFNVWQTGVVNADNLYTKLPPLSLADAKNITKQIMRGDEVFYGPYGVLKGPLKVD